MSNDIPGSGPIGDWVEGVWRQFAGGGADAFGSGSGYPPGWRDVTRENTDGGGGGSWDAMPRTRQGQAPEGRGQAEIPDPPGWRDATNQPLPPHGLDGDVPKALPAEPDSAAVSKAVPEHRGADGYPDTDKWWMGQQGQSGSVHTVAFEDELLKHPQVVSLLASFAVQLADQLRGQQSPDGYAGGHSEGAPSQPTAPRNVSVYGVDEPETQNSKLSRPGQTLME